MRAAAAVLLLAVAAVVAVTTLTAAEDPVPDYAAEGYVGPDACRSCHVLHAFLDFPVDSLTFVGIITYSCS